jgi:protein-S-isoprenylcysteine O-methyltransferase Ste14
MFFITIGFAALLIVPALDYRFGWSAVPVPVVIAGDVLVALGFYVIFIVYKENTFASATIEVASDQRVVSTGPYARVRHPMYAGGLSLMIGTPLALGSYWGLLAFVATGPFLLWRIFDEERFLARNLPGYTEYQETVPTRVSVQEADDGLPFPTTLQTVRSTPLELNIVAADASWYDSQLREIASIFDSGANSNEKMEAARRLSHLDTEAAAVEMARRYLSGKDSEPWVSELHRGLDCAASMPIQTASLAQ